MTAAKLMTRRDLFRAGGAATAAAAENLEIPAIDYRAKDLDARLQAAFPDGIDVFSDGVAAELSESVTRLMKRNSRYFAYGAAGPIYSEKPRIDSPQHATGGPRAGHPPQIAVRTCRIRSIRS